MATDVRSPKRVSEETSKEESTTKEESGTTTKRVSEDNFQMSDHYSKLEAKLLPNGNLCICEMADGGAPVIVVDFRKYTDWMTLEQKQEVAGEIMRKYDACLTKSLKSG